MSDVYVSVNNILGEQNTIQIGSYRRFTAITPMHDLDVLYILGKWQPNSDPGEALADVERKLAAAYEPPKGFHVQISRQSHSITMELRRGGDVHFSVDVVPAYSKGVNAYGEDMYMVPEIADLSPNRRADRYLDLINSGELMGWIPSDPRGYNRAATEMNGTNQDFRRATKFLKGWRAFRKASDDEFKLKSFHIEQLVFQFFAEQPNEDIFGAIFHVMRNLDRKVYQPQIRDRADPERFIDEYVRDLTITQRKKIISGRDGFMIALEDLQDNDSPRNVIEAEPRYRIGEKETYLFDQGIPILTDTEMKIVGNVRPRKGGFRAFVLDQLGIMQWDREIDFEILREVPSVDLYKWKVKNDDGSAQPRGEITDHHTLKRPEHTKYRGEHYAECFAIRNGICIARDRQNVTLTTGKPD